MGIREKRLRDLFETIVTIDSPSFEERKMADFIKGKLSSLGLFVFEDNAGAALGGNGGNVYGFLPGDEALAPLLFCAHMDTVEPGRNKRAVAGENGAITSAGDTILGADDGAGIAAILEALTVIVEEKLPHRPVEVLFTITEEVYCQGVERFDFSKIRAKEAYVLDLAGPVGSAALQAPTILSFAVKLLGKASHAGFAPKDGVHAVLAASRAVSRLPMGQIDDETTLNIGEIAGGRATNIIPESCLVRGEIRSFSHERCLSLYGEVKKTFTDCALAIGAKAEFSEHIGCAAYKTPAGHPVVSRFRAACERLGLPFLPGKTFGGSDNNVLAAQNIAGIVTACAMYRCHSTEEYTTLPDLMKSAGLTLCLMAGDLPD